MIVEVVTGCWVVGESNLSKYKNSKICFIYYVFPMSEINWHFLVIFFYIYLKLFSQLQISKIVKHSI